ncbi:MAG: flagellar basal body-associated FliL family protein [Gemmobacter sp.]|jgi:flagellar basal body-associated protein FliL|nr:flagellar basal body-associated FliL family protein [Gemmobacter sp.]
MKRILIPLILVVLGLSAGLGAGLWLRPATQPEADAAAPRAPAEYVKLPNQFIIPVLEEGRVASLVVMTLSFEAVPGSREAIYEREPKLRDAFLQILFDHANSGGFRGSFTDVTVLLPLRKALLETARGIMPDMISDVLITDIGRQDS